jgi:hypothetical protein
MKRDLRYAREIYGLINTSGRKDFSYVWESPWVEEHVRDTVKRKKTESFQRSLAVKNFLKASSANDSDNVEKFITNVDILTKWEDKYDSKEEVKTISRVIQSFERVSVRQIMNFINSVSGNQYPRLNLLFNRIGQDSSIIANTLRRSDELFDVFANMVATEINWADGTNGSKNLSIHMSKQLQHKKDNALMKLIHTIDNDINIHRNMNVDSIGIPLMNIDFNMCVSHGVIVVGQESNVASYILDIEGRTDANGMLNLTGVRTINISQQISESKIEKLKLHEKRVSAKVKTLVDI